MGSGRSTLAASAKHVGVLTDLIILLAVLDIPEIRRLHLSCRVWQAQIVGVIRRVLLKWNILAISTRSLGFKMLPIDISSGTLRAVVNQCFEFASVVDWYCSCRLLCRVAVSAVSNPCWKGAFVVCYTHVISTGSM